jgi:carbon-monoxide dehydrogenase small subunit
MTMDCGHLNVNGRTHPVDMTGSERLVDVLREQLGLRGTHEGCDTAQCGTCTVNVDDRAVKSCNVLAAQMVGKTIRTIESVADHGGELHLIQRAFSEHHALQCGYCTSGFVMRTLAMVHEDVPAEPLAVRQALGGNLCRCTGYEGIVNAVVVSLRALRNTAETQ